MSPAQRCHHKLSEIPTDFPPWISAFKSLSLSPTSYTGSSHYCPLGDTPKTEDAPLPEVEKFGFAWSTEFRTAFQGVNSKHISQAFHLASSFLTVLLGLMFLASAFSLGCQDSVFRSHSRWTNGHVHLWHTCCHSDGGPCTTSLG